MEGTEAQVCQIKEPVKCSHQGCPGLVDRRGDCLESLKLNLNLVSSPYLWTQFSGLRDFWTYSQILPHSTTTSALRKLPKRLALAKPSTSEFSNYASKLFCFLHDVPVTLEINCPSLLPSLPPPSFPSFFPPFLLSFSCTVNETRGCTRVGRCCSTSELCSQHLADRF